MEVILKVSISGPVPARVSNPESIREAAEFFLDEHVGANWNGKDEMPEVKVTVVV